MSLLVWFAHALAASAASTPRLPPQLLLAVAVVESDLRPEAASAVSTPGGPGGLAYCGPIQTMATTAAECQRVRSDLWYGYARGAQELERWLDDPRVRGDVRLALLGHGCGNAGLAAGSCAGGYERRVFGVLAWLAPGR